mmetsp:Transcript_87269/g.182659  ORF Transcript_87269/g.182659 Transcript_87269/m.182659 type:complete len:251 (-) Transcript_87269:259-1011(-)
MSAGIFTAYRQQSGNPLLLQNHIGQARPPTHSLPPKGHAYGLAAGEDPEGVRELIGSWAHHKPRPGGNLNVKDYLKLNKLAAREGVISAPKVREWRVQNNIKLIRSGSQGALVKPVPSDYIPQHSYGRSSRPTTPIRDLLGNRYGQQQEQAMEAQYQRVFEDRERAQSLSGRRTVKMNRASRQQISSGREHRSRLEAAPDPAPNLFKMSKFKHVPSRLGVSPTGAAAPLLPRASSAPCLRPSTAPSSVQS